MFRKPVRRALLSVSDKSGLVELGHALRDHGADLVATSSTAAALREAGIDVVEVSELSGYPEILGGRVKTLHPAIHAGLLARQNLDEDLKQLRDLDIAPFDAVIVNLYPFSETLKSGASPADCVEMIDIGGPTIVRAAAKNFNSLAVVSSVSQYTDLIESIAAGGTTLKQRRTLATEAFQLIADYDLSIANWFTTEGVDDAQEDEVRSLSNDVSDLAPKDPTPPWIGMSFNRQQTLRYGENPHQKAALYADDSETGLANAIQLGGKPLSFNNFQDTEAALSAVADFCDPTLAIIKHVSPCGIASGATITDAYRKALSCDPLSAFGGVVAANRPIDLETAQEITKVFTEVVAAPSFTEDALEVLRTKTSLRILEVTANENGFQFRQISGGVIVQEADRILEHEAPANWSLVAGKPASPHELDDLNFAWKAVKSVKSNAILLAKNQAAVGVSMGQVNRVDSAKLAVQRANTLAGSQQRALGSVAASDAFFPFADGLQVLIDAGVTAIVSPGGSKRDPEVIAAAEAANVTLYFTGVRHFWH